MTLSNPDGRSTVLVVDDVPENLTLMASLLRERYRVKVATSGQVALEIAASAPPDLMDAGGISPDLAQKRQHRLPYTGVQRCRGVIIEINRSLHRVLK